MKNKLRSDISAAKNLGASGSGTKHWWHQRFTAILLFLTVFWVFCFSWEISGSETHIIIEVLKKPYHIMMLILFVTIAFYHATLGIQVVIEDYIPSRVARVFMLLLVQIFSIVTVLSFIVSVLYIMTL